MGFFPLHFTGTMGNTMSVPEEAEEDNMCTVKSYQVSKNCPFSPSLVIAYCKFLNPMMCLVQRTVLFAISGSI